MKDQIEAMVKKQMEKIRDLKKKIQRRVKDGLSGRDLGTGAGVVLAGLLVGVCAAGCSAMTPASKYQGMDVDHVTITLNLDGAELALTNGVPVVDIDIASQAAANDGDDTHTPTQTTSPTITPDTTLTLSK